MGKKSPSPPPIPDPTVTIAAQSAANSNAAKESARLSAIDVNNPYYSTSYDKDPSGLPLAQNTTLSAPFAGIPAQTGALLAAILASGGGLAGSLPTAPLDLSSVGFERFQPTGLPGNLEADFSGADVDRLIQSHYDKGLQLMTPEFDRGERQLTQSLADRGLPIGGEAYGVASDRFARQKNQSLEQLAGSAIQAGYGESHAQFTEAMAKAQGNQALRNMLYGEQQTTTGINQGLQTDAINRALAQYDLPFSEIAKFLGTAGGSTPQIQAAALPSHSILQPPDVTGAYQTQYQQQLAQYNAAQQQRNAGMSGLFQLGSTLLPLIFG
jgi:hypothetical protein